jgi:hypothetical protein
LNVENRRLTRKLLWKTLNETTLQSLAINNVGYRKIELVSGRIDEHDVHACCVLAVSLDDPALRPGFWAPSMGSDLLATFGSTGDFVCYVALSTPATRDNTSYQIARRQARYAYPAASNAGGASPSQRLAEEVAQSIARRCAQYEQQGRSRSSLSPFITKLRWLRLSTGEILTGRDLVRDNTA